ncbi:MAG: TIGR02996 domain-containing protein [Gemmataceae bacterium]|nr:TIGR02996 domain-containing protein [Gemmataceae bacterium]
MREAFENSLRDARDDFATWCAFADWLAEQGDPLGAFMQTQLALEDESRSKDERDALKAREAELLAAHRAEWLGPLEPFLFPPPGPAEDDPDGEWDVPPPIEFTWRRGFLDSIRTPVVNTGLGQALADSPAAVLLRELRIESHSQHSDWQDFRTTPRVPTPPGVSYHEGYFELIGSRCLESVRVFRTGDEDDEPPEDGWCDCHSHLDGLEHLLLAMPRAEEFHLLSNSVRLRTVFASDRLTRLRVFRAYHIGEERGADAYYEYPLDVLAANLAFANLTHLLFHPHQSEEGYEDTAQSYLPLDQVRALVNSPHLTKLTHLQLRLSDMGDAGVGAIVASGILKRLKWLDLRHGCITDDGARLFAAHPDARNLDRLDLSYNGVTAAGLKALRDAGVNAVANHPLTQDQLDSREYLTHGDFE